jgi:hypothetical protein
MENKCKLDNSIKVSLDDKKSQTEYEDLLLNTISLSPINYNIPFEQLEELNSFTLD